MKNYEEVLGEAVRIDYIEGNGKLYLVFEITNERFKNKVKTSWVKDIEYRIVDKFLKESDSENDI